jgi:hypothetical protein
MIQDSILVCSPDPRIPHTAVICEIMTSRPSQSSGDIQSGSKGSTFHISNERGHILGTDQGLFSPVRESFTTTGNIQ